MKAGPAPLSAIKGRCNHYTGVYSAGLVVVEKCDAGVNYRELAGGEGAGWLARLPCTTTHLSKDVVPCAKMQLPTPEQIAAYDAWLDLHLKVISDAMKLCRENADGKRGVRGSVECPECGGKLHYSIAGSNGHLWGACETDGCLSWVQ